MDKRWFELRLLKYGQALIWIKGVGIWTSVGLQRTWVWCFKR